MAEEIEFENRHFFKLQVSRDLGWPWKSYHRECLIDFNKYHYLVCGLIVFHCGRTEVHKDERTDGHF